MFSVAKRTIQGKWGYGRRLMDFSFCGGARENKRAAPNTIEVTASAYTSSANETDSTPTLTAWGDTLKPGMKAIAVSRDLIDMGLSHGAEVSIEGLSGTYTVMDKMNKSWNRKIDIYMGNDVERAKEWGARKVVIRWSDGS